MKRRIINVVIGFLLILGLKFFSPKFLSLNFDNSRALVERLYQDINGFILDQEECDMLRQEGIEPTYGEITYKAVKTLLHKLKLNDRDVFYDLGSGVGKMVVQTYLTTPVRKAVGIELSPTRHEKAVTVKNRLQEDGYVDDERGLEFIKENFAQADFHDATVIYFASTCFDDEFMQLMTEKMATLPQKNVRVVSLKRLPENNILKLCKECALPMTWSDRVSAFIYEKV